MHFTLVAAVAVIAHTTQGLAAPLPVSYEAQNLVARTPLHLDPKAIAAARALAAEAAKHMFEENLHNHEAPHSHHVTPHPKPKKLISLKHGSGEHQNHDLDKVQNLVARTEPNQRFKQTVRKVINKIPKVVTDTPLPSNGASVLQKVVKAVQNSERQGGRTPPPNREFHHAHPQPAPHQKTAIEKHASSSKRKHHRRGVQNLEARAGPNQRFKQTVRKVINNIPKVVTDTPLPSNGASVLQKVVKAVQNSERHGGRPPPPNREFHHAHPAPPPHQKTAIEKQASASKRKHHRRGVQNLVARTETRAKFQKGVRKAISKIPKPILNTPLPSNGASAIQAVLRGVQNAELQAQAGGRQRTSPHPLAVNHGGAGHHRRDLDLDIEARDLEIDELD
jgi:uncharacterized protein (UPF0147 family)